MSIVWNYSRGFYEATLSQPHPKEIGDIVVIVEGRLGTIGEIEAMVGLMTLTVGCRAK